MNLTTTQRTTLKTHVLANTNTVKRPSDETVVAINTIANDSHGDNYQRIADWYNLTVTGTENQPFTTPNELWVPDVGIQSLNTAIDFGNASLVPATGATGNTEIFLLRIYKMLLWQTGTWNSRIDMTDPQQRALVFNTFGVTPAVTTVAIAAVGVGRKTATRIERLYAAAASGQAGIGGAIGRVAGVDAGLNRMYGQTLAGGDVSDAILNG